MNPSRASRRHKQRVEIEIDVLEVKCVGCGRLAPPPDIEGMAEKRVDTPLQVGRVEDPVAAVDRTLVRTIRLGSILQFATHEPDLRGWVSLWAPESRGTRQLCPDCTPASVRKAVSKDE